MKNLLKWWKLWTMLSILVFVMTCWILTYAFWGDPTQSPFADWRTDKQLGSSIEELEWNYLMTKLDTLGGVPKWAVMAFDLSECPEWWEAYSDADGRVIKGAWTRYAYVDDRTFSRVYSKWATGWSPYMYLKSEHMPEHFHYMIAVDKVGSNWFRDNLSEWKDWSLAERWSSNDWTNEDRYDLAASNQKATAARTSTVWSSYPTQFSIEDPYIVLIYCKKK